MGELRELLQTNRAFNLFFFTVPESLVPFSVLWRECRSMPETDRINLIRPFMRVTNKMTTHLATFEW